MTISDDKEKELLRLIQAKSERLANDYLMEYKHTQLSYLKEPERKFRIEIPKEIILDKLISYLRSI